MLKVEVRILFLCLFILQSIVVSSCKETGKPEHDGSVAATTSPITYKEGMLIDSYQEKIVEDELNDLSFSVKLLADSLSESGDFALKIIYAHTEGESRLKLPYQMLDGRPALRKGAVPYQVVAGFYQGADTTFHEMVLITGSPERVSIEQIKAYRLR